MRSMQLSALLLLLVLLHYVRYSLSFLSNDELRQQLFADCNLQPSSTLPNNYREPDHIPYPIPVSARFSVARMINLDDVHETMTVTAGLQVTFVLDCLAQAALRLNATERIPGYLMITDTENYWKPPIIHANSLSDYGLTKDLYPAITAEPFSGRFTYAYSGVFTSTISLDLVRFPFDKQPNCSLMLSMFLTSSMIAMKNVDLDYLVPFDEVISVNLGWKLLEISASFAVLPFKPNDFTAIFINFAIQRQPLYFIITIIVPLVLLTILQFSIFYIPPEFPERPGIAVTLFLSFSVIQANITASVPKTPNNMLLNDLILCELVSSLVISAATSFTCGWYDAHKELANKKRKFLCIPGVRICRIMDVIIAFFIAVLLIVVNMSFGAPLVIEPNS